MIWSQRGGGGGGGGGEMAGVVMECSYQPHLRIHLTTPRQQQVSSSLLSLYTGNCPLHDDIDNNMAAYSSQPWSGTLYIRLCCVGVLLL